MWKFHISQWLMLCKRLCIYLKSGWSKHLFVSHNYKNSVSTFKWSCQKQRKEYAKISINYIKSGYAATVFCHCSSTVQFWWDTLFFFNSSYSIKQHCIYNSTVFFFWVFRLYFFCFIYIVILTQWISQLLMCQFLISQNKIIKYETVTNHN